MKKHKLAVGAHIEAVGNQGDGSSSPAVLEPQRIVNRGHKLALVVLTCAIIGSFHANASTTVTFEESAVNTPLSDVPGWVVSAADNLPGSPLSWITEYDSGGTLSKAAAIGGFYDVPASSTYRATVGAETRVSGALIAFDLGIFDSSNLFPERDTFGFSLNALAGSPFMSVLFKPIAQSPTPEDVAPPGLWQVSYTFRGGSAVNTAFTLSEGAIYNMSISFLGGSVVFGIDDGISPISFAGLPAGYAPGTDIVSGIAFDWAISSGNINYGDNFMIVDNIQGIPEPGRVMLLGLGTLSILFRRQRRV
jgi:hypothetical protein